MDDELREAAEKAREVELRTTAQRALDLLIENGFLELSFRPLLEKRDVEIADLKHEVENHQIAGVVLTQELVAARKLLEDAADSILDTWNQGAVSKGGNSKTLCCDFTSDMEYAEDLYLRMTGKPLCHVHQSKEFAALAARKT